MGIGPKIAEYTNERKPFDILRRPFHRIHSPNYDLAVDEPDLFSPRPRPSGDAHASGARAPKDFMHSALTDILGNVIVRVLEAIVQAGLPLVPFFGARTKKFLDLREAFDNAFDVFSQFSEHPQDHQDAIGRAEDKLSDLLAQTAEGALFGRFMRSIPSWVPVGRLGYGPKFKYEDKPTEQDKEQEEEREVEGTLTRSFQTCTDVPHFQWSHFSHWAFHVKPLPGYAYMIGDGNLQSPEEHATLADEDLNRVVDLYNRVPSRAPGDQGSIECLWDVGAFSRPPGELPAGQQPKTPGVMFNRAWPFWPMAGDHFWAAGRWVYDCTRPERNNHASDAEPERFPTQINPCKAIATARYEGFEFPENESKVPALRFFFFGSTEGGYVNFRDSTSASGKPQKSDVKLRDRNYEFIVDLPPLQTGISPYAVGHTSAFKLNTIALRPRLLKQVRFAKDFLAEDDFGQFAEGLTREKGFPEIEPIVEVLRPADPKQRPSQAKITVPLTSLPADDATPTVYGFVLTLGWFDADGAQAASLARVVVSLRDLDLLDHPKNVRLKTCINGRWSCFQTDAKAGNDQKGKNLRPDRPIADPSVADEAAEELFLPRDGSIAISVHGVKRNGFGQEMEEDSRADRLLSVGGLINLGKTTKKAVVDLTQQAKNVPIELTVLRNIDLGKEVFGDETLTEQIAASAFGKDFVKDLLDKAPDELFGDRHVIDWKEDVDTDKADPPPGQGKPPDDNKNVHASAIARELFAHPAPIFFVRDEPLGWIEAFETRGAKAGLRSVGRITPLDNVFTVDALVRKMQESGTENLSVAIALEAEKLEVLGSGAMLGARVNARREASGVDEPIDYKLSCGVTVELVSRKHTGTLDVSVRDETGTALFDALVHVAGPISLDRRSNGSGLARFTDLPPGTYSIRANGDGIEAAGQPVDMTGQPQAVTVQLKKVPPAVTKLRIRKLGDTRDDANVAVGGGDGIELIFDVKGASSAQALGQDDSGQDVPLGDPIVLDENGQGTEQFTIEKTTTFSLVPVVAETGARGGPRRAAGEGPAPSSRPKVQVQVAPPATRLRIRLLDNLGQPLTGIACELEIGGTRRLALSPLFPKTDDKGILEALFPIADTGAGFLLIHLTPGFVFRMPLKVQRFDDPDQSPGLGGVGPVGARARLNNLGYVPSIADLNAPLDDLTRRALTRFQEGRGILAAVQPGELDGPTQTSLTVAHDTDKPFGGG